MRPRQDAALEVEVLGISKERDDDSPSIRVKRGGGLKAERIFRPNRANPIMLAPSSRGMLLLQRVRDESHRFAIEYQRDLRSKVNMTSILEELPGIGPGKRKALLKTLGSLRAVRNATVAELLGVPGVSARDAESIRRFFDALTAPEVVAEADGPDEVEGLEETEGLDEMEGLEETEGLVEIEEVATEVAPQSDEESARELPTPDGKGSA